MLTVKTLECFCTSNNTVRIPDKTFIMLTSEVISKIDTVILYLISSLVSTLEVCSQFCVTVFIYSSTASVDKKAVLPQRNLAMPWLFFSV